jgi:flagellar biosynthetic protein FlhB
MIGHGLIDFTRLSMCNVRNAAVGNPFPGGFYITSSAAPLLGATAAWLIMLLVGSLTAGFSQAGFVIATEAMEPRWSILNPVTGFSRIFSLSSLVRTLSAVLKVAFIILVCQGTVRELLKTELFYRPASGSELISFLLQATFSIGWRFTIAMIVIAVADYAYQHWQHEKNLRMTKEDVKEENKQSEPNPLVRGKLRGKMKEFFLKRLKHVRPMLKEVPRATVVITNPTHVAVALRYDRASMKAPHVVAKGLRLMAERIKECARQNHVPIVENRSLARGLYRKCSVGYEIPPVYFAPVAAVLAQIFRLAARKNENNDRMVGDAARQPAP